MSEDFKQCRMFIRNKHIDFNYEKPIFGTLEELKKKVNNYHYGPESEAKIECGRHFFIGKKSVWYWENSYDNYNG